MNKNTKHILISFLPIGILCIMVMIGLLSSAGDSDTGFFRIVVIYILGLILWDSWNKNKKQKERLSKATLLLSQDTNTRALELLDIAMEAYNSSPESLRTREMLMMAHRRLKEESHRKVVGSENSV